MGCDRPAQVATGAHRWAQLGSFSAGRPIAPQHGGAGELWPLRSTRPTEVFIMCVMRPMGPAANITMRIAAAVAAGAASLCSAARPCLAEGEKYDAYVVVFDFAGDTARGRAIADSLRLGLRAHKEFFVVDRLSTQEVSGPTAATAETAGVVELMRRKLGANLGICGTVTVSGPKVTLEARCIDLIDPAKPAGWTKSFSDSTERYGAVISKAVIEHLRGRPEWTPPEYGDAPQPSEFGQPLNVNGTFEAGHKGWEQPDNCASFLVRGPKGRGRILKIRTDLPNEPWVAYHRRLRLGLADPTRPPKLPRDTSYNSVGGYEGVHYCSDWIRATPGQRYWLVADIASDLPLDGLGPKIFVKGYQDYTEWAKLLDGGLPEGLPEKSLIELKLTPKAFAELSEARQKELIAADVKRHPARYRRERWRWQVTTTTKIARSAKDGWHHFAEPFPPRGGMSKDVQWLQIQIYPYWPPTTYYYDNVHIYADPAQKAPLAEAAPRTKNYGRTSDVVERETRQDNGDPNTGK